MPDEMQDTNCTRAFNSAAAAATTKTAPNPSSCLLRVLLCRPLLRTPVVPRF